MLAKRVIPCMDVKDGRVVKGVNFVNLRDAGDPIELAQRYDEQRADEVIFLDITATSDKRETTVDLASRASAQLHLPYCVGGGFRSVADIRHVLDRHGWSTVWGVRLYFWARLIYVFLYAGNVVGARTVAFLVSVVGIVLVLVGLT